jgi:hypothetical protein
MIFRGWALIPPIYINPYKARDIKTEMGRTSGQEILRLKKTNMVNTSLVKYINPHMINMVCRYRFPFETAVSGFKNIIQAAIPIAKTSINKITNFGPDDLWYRLLNIK